MKDKQILFIGCGKMGSAMITNLLADDFSPEQFLVIKPSKNNLIPKIKYLPSYKNLPKNYQADIIIFVFKPQLAKEILSDFSQHKITNPKTIFISILAGKKIIFFEQILGKKAKIIRLMPNLPTLINQGIFGYYPNVNITKSDLGSLTQFFGAIGKNIEVEKEELIDVITAVSGSGPAYLFLFIQSLIEAAIDLGLDKKSANMLVKQAIYGSAKMALQSDQDLESLITSVASKGGTTEAALKVLYKNNQFKKIIFDAIKTANKKSINLAK